MNLLVVDWDYFLPMLEPNNPDAMKDGLWMLYDWGHSEMSPIFYELAWFSRASQFMARGLPLPGTSGLEKTFWQRFKINPKSVLYYADSNVFAFDKKVKSGITRPDLNHVYLFDAHADCGGYSGSPNLAALYKRRYFTCEEWMVGYCGRAELHVRYPKWKAKYAFEIEPTPLIDVDRQIDDERSLDVGFQRVFVCRSSAWMPPWCDEQFEQFIAAAPVRKRVALHEMKRRELDFDAIKRDSEMLKQHQRIVQEANEKARKENAQS